MTCKRWRQSNQCISNQSGRVPETLITVILITDYFAAIYAERHQVRDCCFTDHCLVLTDY